MKPNSIIQGDSLTVLSLFSGIGGFELGLEAVGIETVLQVENNKFCLQLLNDKWPEVEKLHDIRRLLEPGHKTRTVDIICGGDPCQSRSIALGGRKSKNPDLSGSYLGVVAKYRPRWVVRENVRASDVKWFVAGMELLRYRTIILELDARDFTGQSRPRQFVVGCSNFNTAEKFNRNIFTLLKENIGCSFGTQGYKEKSGEVGSCLRAHPMGLAPNDNYCYEQGQGLRVLTCEEREALQGFPRGWTAGFSFSRRCIMIGNAVPPPVVEWIAKRIVEAETKPRQEALC